VVPMLTHRLGARRSVCLLPGLPAAFSPYDVSSVRPHQPGRPVGAPGPLCVRCRPAPLGQRPSLLVGPIMLTSGCTACTGRAARQPPWPRSVRPLCHGPHDGQLTRHPDQRLGQLRAEGDLATVHRVMSLSAQLHQCLLPGQQHRHPADLAGPVPVSRPFTLERPPVGVDHPANSPQHRLVDHCPPGRAGGRRGSPRRPDREHHHRAAGHSGHPRGPERTACVRRDGQPPQGRGAAPDRRTAPDRRRCDPHPAVAGRAPRAVEARSRPRRCSRRSG